MNERPKLGREQGGLDVHMWVWPEAEGQGAFAQAQPLRGVDPNPDSGHSAKVTDGPSQTKLWLFRLVAGVWLATAIPIILLSALLLELPMWPTFGPDTTTEGIVIWAVIAAWFYVTPAVLIVVDRRWNRLSAS